MASTVIDLPLDTLRGDNLETFSLLWLDTPIDYIQKNVDTQQQLRTLINRLEIFQDDQECERYIQSISTEIRLVLLVSCESAQKLVPRIHQLRQLSLIYVYSMDEKADQQWAVQFTKVNNHSPDNC